MNRSNFYLFGQVVSGLNACYRCIGRHRPWFRTCVYCNNTGWWVVYE